VSQAASAFPERYRGLYLTPSEWEQVVAILAGVIPEKKVWAFGSRATGVRLKRFSDLDLAVEGRLSWAERAGLGEAFDESALPFKVDVVELGLVEAGFGERMWGILWLCGVEFFSRWRASPEEFTSHPLRWAANGHSHPHSSCGSESQSFRAAFVGTRNTWHDRYSSPA
jgi:predicted nucleotidyltransferase